MPDYSKGKIYTVRCRTDASLIYVGSTIQPLAKRVQQHKFDDKITLYKLVNETFDGDWSQFYIELHELYPCSSKEELNKREGEIQRQIGTINKYIAGRTKQEYIEDNKQAYLEYHKQYRKKHIENNKIYRELNIDKLKSYNKEYREQNREQIQLRHKLYYLQKITCECGCEVINGGLPRHLKSQKHNILIKQKEDNLVIQKIM